MLSILISQYLTMNRESALKLVEACMASNLELVNTLLSNPECDIDVDVFLKEIRRELKQVLRTQMCWTPGHPDRGVAIGLVLTAHKDHIDVAVIEGMFCRLSLLTPTVMPVLINLFADNLTSGLVNYAINNYGPQHLGTVTLLIANCTAKLLCSTIAQAFVICCKYQLPDLLTQLLNLHGREVEKLYITADPFGKPESLSYILACLCRSGDINVARAFMDGCGKQSEAHILSACIRVGELEIARSVFDDYSEYLTTDSLNKGFVLACEKGDLDMMDLFIDNFGSPETFQLEAGSIIAFNAACEAGQHEVIELLLERCGVSVWFENNLTFEPTKVQAHIQVTNLLIDTFGPHLLEQFPALTADPINSTPITVAV